MQIMVDRVNSLSLEIVLKNAQDAGRFDKNDKIIGVPRLKFDTKEEPANALNDLDESKEENDLPYIIKLDPSKSAELLKELKPLLERYKGSRPTEIHIQSGKSLKRIKVPFGITVNEDFETELKKVLVA